MELIDEKKSRYTVPLKNSPEANQLRSGISRRLSYQLSALPSGCQ
jgi:hypothetical protein